jgi:hypothetical protein
MRDSEEAIVGLHVSCTAVRNVETYQISSIAGCQCMLNDQGRGPIHSAEENVGGRVRRSGCLLEGEIRACNTKLQPEIWRKSTCRAIRDPRAIDYKYHP